MILLILLIALNIIVCSLNPHNKVFPVFFIMSTLSYGISIIAESELYIALLMLFCTIYNIFMILEQKRRRMNGYG